MAVLRFKGIPVRGYAERVPGTTKFRFICPHGHVTIDDITLQGSGKRRRRVKIGETGIQMMESWWSKEKGGCTFNCNKCKG
jgi:hypothetical protein